MGIGRVGSGFGPQDDGGLGFHDTDLCELIHSEVSRALPERVSVVLEDLKEEVNGFIIKILASLSVSMQTMVGDVTGLVMSVYQLSTIGGSNGRILSACSI